MTLFIIANILVASSSFLFSRIIFPKKWSVDFILSWFVLFLSQIIIVELFFGIINQLFISRIITLHLIVFLLAFLIYFNRREYLTKFDYELDISFIFNNKLLLFALSIFIGFFLIKFWNNLINPSVCPDSLQYHLSFPATWLKNGNLNNPIVIFGTPPTSAEMTALTYYPINAELWFFWLIAPLRNAFLADVGQAPFYILGILAIYSILRKYSFEKNTALFIGLLWVLIPNLFKQIKNGSQIDVICAVLFLLVFNNLLRLNKEFNFKNAALFGISLGIFIGTKSLNIFWFLATLPLLAYFIYKHSKKDGIKKVFFCLAAVLFFIFLFGSFTYLRTFALTGNPFYPVSLEVFGKTILPGIIDKVTFSKIFVSWDEFHLKNMFFSEGLGLQFLALIFPGTIVPLLTFPFLSRHKKDKDLIEYILLFSAPLIMLTMYLFYIKAYWIRYFFPYLGMGLIAAVIFLDKLKWGRGYITVVGGICILSSAAELAHRKELIISFILSFLLFAFLFYFRKNILAYYKDRLSYKHVFFVTLALIAAFWFLNVKYNNEEFSRYPQLFKGNESQEKDIALAWRWLNENTGGGKKVAYTGRNEFYPLFGQLLKNKVVYVSVNNKPSLPHYYEDGLYRKDKYFDSWEDNLRKERVDCLFIALPFPLNNESEDINEFPIEDKWAQAHPENFKLLFNNSKAKIYSVVF